MRTVKCLRYNLSVWFCSTLFIKSEFPKIVTQIQLYLGSRTIHTINVSSIAYHVTFYSSIVNLILPKKKKNFDYF